MAHNEHSDDNARMRAAARSAERWEGVKGFFDGFSSFAAFGAAGGILVAGAVLASMALFGGGAAAIAAAGGALKLATIITVSSLAVGGIIGGSYFCAKRMRAQREEFRSAFDEEEPDRDRPRGKDRDRGRTRDRDEDDRDTSRAVSRSRNRERDFDDDLYDDERDTSPRKRPQWLDAELRRGTRSHEDRLADDAPYSGRYH